MTETIVVTGALGNVGSAVVSSLLDRGASVRAADIHLEALQKRFGEQVESVLLDFSDATTFGPVVAGAASVFLIRPPAISRVGPTLNRFIDAAVGADVGHVVFSSVAGAESNVIVPHHRVEKHLLGSDVAWTMLRPGFFSQNIGSSYRRDIVEDDRIVLPAGDGVVAFIDTRDLGAAAAVCLTEDGHRGVAYHLTGPEAVTFDQVAELLTEVLGRPVRYEAVGAIKYFRHLRGQGLVLAQAVVRTILHAGLKRGDAEAVTDELPMLLGRPSRTIRDYVEDNRDLWTATAEASAT